MNPWIYGMKTQHRSILRNALLSAGLLAGLSACASTGAPTPTALPVSAGPDLAQFEAGQADLSCGVACANTWQSSQSDLSSLYQSADWRSLAQRVLQINYRQDLGYFYLGRAAEALRRRAAALAYYRTAADLARGSDNSTKCIASATRCNGINLLDETLLRIQIVSTPRRAVAQARNTGRTAVRSRPDASSSAWVDPPPVTH